MSVTFYSRVATTDGDAVNRTPGSFVAGDGCALFAHRWTSGVAESGGAALLVVMHGYGEHCERYDEVASHLVRAGHPVYAFDARGHGHSPGQRGHIRFHDQFVDDMQRFLIEVRARYQGRPLVLLGHSHGGLIALRTLQTRKPAPDGLILCSPMIELQPRYGWVPLWLADAIARVLSRLPLPSGIDAAILTHDESIVEASKRDPLSHTRTTPRWYSEAGHAMVRARNQLAAITLPVMILIGDEDKLVKPSALKAMASAIPSTDKEVVVFPEDYHEILNEKERQQTYRRLTSWLSARFGAAVAA